MPRVSAELRSTNQGPVPKRAPNAQTGRGDGEVWRCRRGDCRPGVGHGPLEFVGTWSGGGRFGGRPSWRWSRGTHPTRLRDESPSPSRGHRRDAHRADTFGQPRRRAKVPRRCNALRPERDVPIGDASRRDRRTSVNHRSPLSCLRGTGRFAEPRAGDAHLGLSVRQSKHVGRRKGRRVEKSGGRSPLAPKVAGTPRTRTPASPNPGGGGATSGSHRAVFHFTTPTPSAPMQPAVVHGARSSSARYTRGQHIRSCSDECPADGEVAMSSPHEGLPRRCRGKELLGDGPENPSDSWTTSP